MPNLIIYIAVAIIVLIFFSVFGSLPAKKPGQAGEKKTLKIIKNFIKKKGWAKEDYLLVRNLILQKENYWSCEIDILLLTRKWIYIIEVKDWGRGKLKGNLNQEYLEWSYRVGKRGRFQKHWMYSPFYQNETHVKRFKSYFQLPSNQNVLSVICFNSPYLVVNLKKNAKSIFENRHLWVSNGNSRNIADLLAYCERKETQLPFFWQLKEKVGQEIFTSEKVRKHRAWSKSVRAGKEFERRGR